MHRDRRLKLLVLTSTFPRWHDDASPRFVADLCAGLARSMDVTVLAPGAAGAAAIEQWDGYTVRRFRYSWPATTQRLADGAILPNLRRNPLLGVQVPVLVGAQYIAATRVMRQERFDAIHAHWAIPQGLVAALLKKHFRVPTVITTHGADVYALNRGPVRWAKRAALRSSDGVTAVSTHLRQQLIALGVDETRIQVLPMGVDTRRFTPALRSESLREALNANGPILLFVGRLVEKKAARYAVEALPAVLGLHPMARLIVVGDGPQRRELEQLVRDRGLTESVQFLGPVSNSDLPAYYASADVFVGPSVVERGGDTESFGVVFAEAMASGCPVVTTDAGGITDVVEHGASGIVVPQRDATAIAAAVNSILSDSARSGDLRRRGIERARAFDHGVIQPAYAELIRSVAEQRRAA